jgi:hypothetical protein
MKMILAVAVWSFVCVTNLIGQQPSSDQKGDKQGSQSTCPVHDAHSQMDERGEKDMGFSQTVTMY